MNTSAARLDNRSTKRTLDLMGLSATIHLSTPSKKRRHPESMSFGTDNINNDENGTSAKPRTAVPRGITLPTGGITLPAGISLAPRGFVGAGAQHRLPTAISTPFLSRRVSSVKASPELKAASTDKVKDSSPGGGTSMLQGGATAALAALQHEQEPQDQSDDASTASSTSALSFCDDDDDSDDIDSDTEEQETLIAKRLVQAAFSSRLSSTTISRLVNNSGSAEGGIPPGKRQRIAEQVSAASTTISAAAAAYGAPAPSCDSSTANASVASVTIAKLARQSQHEEAAMRRQQRPNLIRSAPNLKAVALQQQAEMERQAKQDARRRGLAIVTGVGGSRGAVPRGAAVAPAINPDALLRAILRRQGYNIQTVAALDLVKGEDTKDFFFKPTQETIDGYDMEIAMAVRNGDIECLQRLHDQGRDLQCGNQFGESVVHTVCRRGCANVLEFLINVAKVDIKVCCDSGRTPLHDACWTPDPNLKVVEMLIRECPDFLFITDKRGFVPLAYVHKENWAPWCQFLHQHFKQSTVKTQEPDQGTASVSFASAPKISRPLSFIPRELQSRILSSNPLLATAPLATRLGPTGAKATVG